jgi:putative PIN family toxin of toxin-antitoxin system
MKVVFDTNVYVSAFLVPGGNGEQAFLVARHGRCELVSSVSILTETANVLRSKFHQPDGDVRAALKLIDRAATIVQPESRIHLLEDEPDNRILDCAVTAAADAIVTGDRHLLALKRFRGIAIVRLADFLRMFPPEPGE